GPINLEAIERFAITTDRDSAWIQQVRDAPTRFHTAPLCPACIRADVQIAAARVIPGLKHTEGWKLDSLDGGCLEFVQVLRFERAHPGTRIADFGYHHRRALLAAGIRLIQMKKPAEFFVSIPEESRIVFTFGRGAQSRQN